MVPYQTETIAETCHNIEMSESLDELAAIGRDIFLCSSSWLKEATRKPYAEKLSRLHQGPPQLLLVIDAHNWIYADWHVAQDKAAKMFIDRLDRITEKTTFAWVAVAFDAAQENFRKKLEPSYKSSRDDTPAELLAERTKIQDLLERRGIPALELKGWEADDIIGTLSLTAQMRGDKTVIASNDKDCRQLLSNRTVIWRKDEYYNAKILKEQLQITPSQMVDWLCLVGKDDVPGCKGVGVKTASELLRKHDSVPGILSQIQTFSERSQANLAEFAARYFRVRRLHQIVRDIPLQFNWE